MGVSSVSRQLLARGMGCGFDDADAVLVEETALPFESVLDTIMDPWIESAPSTPVVNLLLRRLSLQRSHRNGTCYSRMMSPLLGM